MTTKKTYTKEFKCDAVRLLETTDKTGAENSRELGIISMISLEKSGVRRNILGRAVTVQQVNGEGGW